MKEEIFIDKQEKTNLTYTPNVTVVDAIMGSGKSSWAIEYMNSQPDTSFVYITPFLSEVDRIKKDCTEQFYEPSFINGRKIDDFNMLLMEGRNIASTHATFSNANSKTLEYLANGHYCLILDEVLNILVNFNDAYEDKLSKSDINLLLNEGFISVDKYGKVTWIKRSYGDSKYAKVESAARSGNLYCLDNTMLVWQFPSEIFKLFDKVYILTYLFEGSILKPYFEYHSIPYQMASVRNNDGAYELCEYKKDMLSRQAYKPLVNIYDDWKANGYRASSLSKAWYESHNNKPEMQKLKRELYNYIRNVSKAKSKDVLWTTFDAFKKKLSGKGFTIVRRLTSDDTSTIIDNIYAELNSSPFTFKNKLQEDRYIRKETNKRKEQLTKSLQCYIPCNSRATNFYRDRSVLAYTVNMYINPYVKRYFENKNTSDGTQIAVDEDYYALLNLLQWIWRSRIRDGEPISIWIPSQRMRKLFTEWLEGAI